MSVFKLFFIFRMIFISFFVSYTPIRYQYAFVDLRTWIVSPWNIENTNEISRYKLTQMKASLWTNENVPRWSGYLLLASGSDREVSTVHNREFLLISRYFLKILFSCRTSNFAPFILDCYQCTFNVKTLCTPYRFSGRPCFFHRSLVT